MSLFNAALNNYLSDRQGSLTGFIIKKALYGVAVLFGVVTAIFFLFNVLPGDPAAMILGQRANKESIAAVHRDLGLDKPLPVQYLNYLNDLSPVSSHNYLEGSSARFL
ncbi:MAG TPA: hypothetical protein VEB42_14035, partial [Chitinophagaceae bacterium]|nr:hypothetical protein [Chitinophagaceae bacterium]